MKRLQSRWDYLMSKQLVIYLVLALVVLTISIMGTPWFSSLIMVVLCLVVLTKLEKPVRVDLWVLVPFVLYNILSALSSWKTFGNLLEGFASIQMVFPVLCLALSCLCADERGLLRNLCVTWVTIVSVMGIGQFVWDALHNVHGRLYGILDNPNSLGIFLVVGWFALLGCENQTDKFSRLLGHAEPVVLVALALTLSMGSFFALLVGTLAFAVIGRTAASERLIYFCEVFSRLVIGVGMGVLMFLAGGYSGHPWLTLLVVAYFIPLSLFWKDLLRFFHQKRKAAVCIAIAGFAVAAGIIWLRPSSGSTLMERIRMSGNAISHMGDSPLLGLGPHQWRGVNLLDDDKYYNTWYIHFVWLHVGVELGVPAMMVFTALSYSGLRRKSTTAWKACYIAFLAHGLFDADFFYTCIPTLLMLTAEQKEPEVRQGVLVNVAWVRVLLIVFLAWALWIFRSILVR